MIANFWLRPGDSYTTNNFLSFLKDTLDKLSGIEVGLLRADSGYSKEIFDYLETGKEQPISYIIAARFIHPTKMKMALQNTWLKLGEGIEIAESECQAADWKRVRRLVMVRQEIEKRPNAAGKKLCLFEQDGVFTYKNYHYLCFITSLSLPPKVVYNLYRGKADAENRIKEVKFDFGGESFNVMTFGQRRLY
ncbi:MAG: hypothetical protein A2X11_10715 [Bacteroidetes bacterium GWE2_42_24]|nr:MAG: hypothetical protein A2X11_10715 [Bacteroidetes bacterium GWE2_42_24]OFY28149.1 MAG: hypothetical protein A2X09_00970 [Bacteroidetes bacterium GWF2_43_11]